MNTAVVERFRGKWDPLAAAVPAHITIAFPFQWPGPLSTLANALHPILTACAAFTLELSTPTVWEQEYLFLLVTDGWRQAGRLHDAIYSQVLRGTRRPSRFIPHMTVGRQPEEAALRVGLSEATAMNLPLTGRAQSLTVYRREEDGTRIRELDMPLGTAP
jgi:2'-5' RNA ligase